jgi:tRNA U34 2-thiouridine synthase MnmA/TrmU
LLKSADHLKDQSFFLSQINPNLLRHVLFPIGGLHKKDVKKIALNIGLDKICKKPSSKGICFVGKRKFPIFINNYLSSQKGPILDLENNHVLGEHDGIFLYTIGQRIPVQQNLNKIKEAYYVAKKIHSENIIYAVNKIKIFKIKYMLSFV